MRRSTRLLGLASAAALGVVLAAFGAAADPAAEAQKIQERVVEWVAAVGAKDVAAIQSMYTADALFMPSNAPWSEGRTAIGKAWEGLLGLPNVALTFGPTRVEVAASGDLAYDLGTYALSFDGDSGRVSDYGKYVVVWRKVDGEWRAVADIFNSNLPAQ